MPDPAAVAGRERLAEQVARTGMFGTQTTGDTSGYGGLQVRRPPRLPSQRPYGSYFDEVADELDGARWTARARASATRSSRSSSPTASSPSTSGASTCSAVASRLRDDPALAFEMCLGVSGVHYPAEAGASCTPSTTCCRSPTTAGSGWRSPRRTPTRTCPSLVDVYPTCDLHERETWDFFGLVFDGHPALTRIEMPDDWRGHPQRKDYPLGGIPVEYRGATIPPPDERRSYE